MPRVRNGTTGEMVADHVTIARGAWTRTIGYLGRRHVAASEGLWFERCSSVHTVGMRATIDIVFLDGQRRIVRIVSEARRNRIVVGGAPAAATLELGPGVARARGLRLGDRLELE